MSAENRVLQAVRTVCVLPFGVLVVVGAPLWGWAIALAAGLVVM